MYIQVHAHVYVHEIYNAPVRHYNTSVHVQNIIHVHARKLVHVHVHVQKYKVMYI